MSQGIRDSLAAVAAAIDGCADDPTYGQTDADLVELLRDAETVMNKLYGAVMLPLLAEVDGRDLGRRNGASSTQAWIQQVLRWRPGKASSMVRLATALQDRLSVTGKALQAGELSPDAAVVVQKALQKLPGDTPAEERARGEQTMLEQARLFDPTGLETLGEKLYETIAPEDAERKLGERLAKEERRAKVRRSLRFGKTGIPGLERADLRLETEAMAKLREMLEPLSAPRSATPEGPDLRPYDRRQADAFTEIIDAHHRQHPTTGPGDTTAEDTAPEEESAAQPTQATQATQATQGRRGRLRRPQLLVTVALDLATQRLGIGTLDTGQRLSPEIVARLACEAGITPVYLDPHGTPLHVGSKARFFGDRDRLALITRDGGCAFPGCDRKPKWCEAHHVVPFRVSQHTRIDDGCLLCTYHHHLIHQGEWKIRIAADGHPEFIPPTWLDPRQNPLRNTMHHR